MINRRKFIGITSKIGVGSLLWPALIEKALAVEADSPTRSINDVKHIVILMQENRSFDHYFGTMKGVRGFGDRFPIPLESGKRAFFQSDGEHIIPPFRANFKTSNAALVKPTPHDFPDMQAAWNQGKYGFWPKCKTPFSMAYYTREEIPFQYALADAFTISDAYHCSIATGTDPNRIMFWSGSNSDPDKRAAGINCSDKDSEPVNQRCWITGKHPDPGYTYKGNAFKWATLPDVLEKAGVSWRIYQDPNDNWTGAMHGCLAFESFRTAKPGSAIYEQGMKHWSLEDLSKDVAGKTLPAVSWILPSRADCEHPGGPSSPYRGADFTHAVLSALTSNPDVWSKTVFFLTFDENDGLFDHLPAPAVPSYNIDGTLAGKSTIDLAGMYFDNSRKLNKRNYIDPLDTISGDIRPWGMGPRVPLYIISPWSKGGWVHSEVADHTSVAQFIEKRFGVVLPAISPWHRSVSSDLDSAFDFKNPNDAVFPAMPRTRDYASVEAALKNLPGARPPDMPEPLFQEKGVKYSRALPYKLNTSAEVVNSELRLTFVNTGKAGVVFHVYDLNHLEMIPRRYTVEAGKTLGDSWSVAASGYDLEVYGPNGYFRKFKGAGLQQEPETVVIYNHRTGGIGLEIRNRASKTIEVIVTSNAYDYGEPTKVMVPAGKSVKRNWNLEQSGNWFDFSVTADEKFLRRFAGRVETSKHSISDPAMATEI
ncbi:phosphocholine-specific phospholipase C [Flavitalea antarctica]